MNPVDISIIVPVYNAEKQLEKCIASILSQTLKTIEVIAVDDGSTDNSNNICGKFKEKDARFKLITQKNSGKPFAVNKGYLVAKGEYVLILDSDDYIEPDLCKTALAIAKEQNVDIVNYNYFYQQNGRSEKRSTPFPKNNVLSKNDFLSLLKKDSHASKLLWFTWTNLIKKELLDKNNIRHDENLRVGVDSTFNLLCYLNANGIYAIEDAFYHYVNNPLSITQRHFKPNLTKHLLNQFKSKLDIYRHYGLTDREYTVDFSRYYIEHSLFFILANELNHPDGYQLKRIKALRNNEMYQYCFRFYKASGNIPIRLRLVIFCFKNKIYFPIKPLLKF
ncbi:glycosyltransferase [Galbibacter sp. PAP.153]|uniref:glycosyltransferase n=1 Tax=Galbibacter sp. PAP.153 TaxID=3104623 RepID=UPI003009E323